MYLWRACWHIGVCNTHALKLANILTSDGLINPEQSLCIPGGVIEVDPTTLAVTGVLKETATELIVSAISKHKTEKDRRKYLSEGEIVFI
jgi:predicted amidohydrolase YtcJ